MVLQQNNQVVLPGVQELQIDISKLTSGLYVYAIQTEAAINYGKFIKL
jgi:hypothetical protein